MALTKASFSMITGTPVNVLDFMTQAEIQDVQSGIGAINVQTAVQAALDSGKAIIFFPYGIYNIGGAGLIVPATVVELRGEGGLREPSRLDFTSTNPSGTALDIQSTIFRGMSNLYLETTTNGCFTNIIKIANDTHFCNWTNVSTFGGATTHWAFGANCFVQCFINCHTWGNDFVGQTGMKLGSASNAFDFFACSYIHCGIGVWLIDYSENINFFGGEIASNASFGVRIGSDSGLTPGLENVNFYGVYFEDNPTHIVQSSINMKGLFINNCRTSETAWTNFVLLTNATFSVHINGGTFLRSTGGTGNLLNVNNQVLVNAYITGPFLFNVTAYVNAGAQQVWYRDNNIGLSPGQISYETKGIEAREDFNTTSSFANKKLKKYLGNNANPAIHDKGFNVVWDSFIPSSVSSVWNTTLFQRGAVCWYSDAAIGDQAGWMCIAAGTPGTWAAMADLI